MQAFYCTNKVLQLLLNRLIIQLEIKLFIKRLPKKVAFFHGYPFG
jgi:hypothetical protein